MWAFYLPFLLIAVYFICHCQLEKINFMCKFKNLNGRFVTPMPDKLRTLLECCGTTTCGGITIHVGSGTAFGTVAPGWFGERVIEADTVYLIKKRQSMVFQTPEPSLGLIYELPMNFTKDVEVALSLTPLTLFQRFRMKLQATNKNQIIMMDMRHDYEGDVNRIIIKWKLHDVWNTSVDAWETSVAPPLVSFPFTSDVNVRVAFKNINDTVQIEIDGVNYMFYNSPVPLAWAHQARVMDDVYLNRIDISDNCIDSETLDVVEVMF